MTDERDELLRDIQRSVRYHDRRTAHFERLHRLTNLTAILLAGVVLMELTGVHSPIWVVRVLAVVGALLGAADLVVGFSRSADGHRDFKRRFVRLERELIGGATVGGVQQERLTVESEEPPIYRALDLLCHNQIAAMMGYNPKDNPKEFSTLTRYQRWTANWYRWPNIGS